MERDFMGLAVKQETPDEIYDAAPVRSLPMQWSFSNKSSSLPQLLSFQNVSDDNKLKSGFESLASSEKSMSADKQGAMRYSVSTTFPTHTNLTISSAMATPVHQSYVAPLPTPANSSVVGTTDLRSSSKISNSPAQLTIFYNGSVCVYDNISPEKAQAIMLLAGNGPQTCSSPTPPVGPIQASMARSSSFDGFSINKPYSTTPKHSSPVPVTPIAVPQSNRHSVLKNDATPTPNRSSPVPVAPIAVPQSNRPGGLKTDATPAGFFVSSPTIAAQPLKAVSPLGSVANLLSTDTVPQFRRKSLARFLEKRKERVISGSPYGDKQSVDGNSSRHSPVTIN